MKLKRILLIFSVLLLASCAQAMPNLINGRYYMAGDAECAKVSVLSSSRIMCYRKDGTPTGYRDAMTDQQLQMYMHNQQMQKTYTTNCNTNIAGTTCTTR